MNRNGIETDLKIQLHIQIYRPQQIDGMFGGLCLE